MKKILTIVCLALATSIAFAQTRQVATSTVATGKKTMKLAAAPAPAKQSVGYNASIFTKAEGDILFECQFSESDAQTGKYEAPEANGAAGQKVRVNDRLNGVLITGDEADNQNGNYGRWHKFDSSSISYLQRAGLANTYPILYRWFGNQMEASLSEAMDTTLCSSDNGWMFMDIFDQAEIGGAAFNKFIRFEEFQIPNDVPIVDFQLYQWYMKFYDKCFVDYSYDGGTNWYSVEINVTNVDVIVNGTISGTFTYTLPISMVELARSENDGFVELRLRWYSNVSSDMAGYGYCWMVDDVKVIAGGESRIHAQPEYYTEGVYQIMPKGMELPVYWHAVIDNAGSVRQNDVFAHIYNYKDGESAELVSEYKLNYVRPGSSIVAYADPFGRHTDDGESYGWWCQSKNTPAHLNGTKHVKTDEAGDYFVYAQVDATPNNPALDPLVHVFDTLYYNVVDADANGNYIWGHDNGILTGNRAYIYGHVIEGSGANQKTFITEYSKHYKSAGYSVSLRYSTGDVVPTDGEGRPWVIRGVQYIPATDTGTRNGTATIAPTLTYDACVEGNASSVRFENIRTGAANITINDDIYDDASIYSSETLWDPDGIGGYLTYGNYDGFFVEFPEQPVLEPNKAYRVGYQLAENAKFAVAASAPDFFYTYFAFNDETGKYDSIRRNYYSMSNDLDTAKYASHTTKAGMLDNPYDVRVFDPKVGENGSSIWASNYYGYYPMIRLVIGPYEEKEKYAINFDCTYEDDLSDYGTIINDGGSNVCGETDSISERSTVSYTFKAGIGAHVESITIDGVLIYDNENGMNYEQTDFIDEGTNQNVEIEGDTLVTIVFETVDADHDVQAVFNEGRRGVGINPVAEQVSMKLQPNPATSQVRLSVEGVSGMLDCSLIDMSGRVVLNDKINAESAKTISLSGLAKGAYFVRITNSKFSKVEKLIVR